MIITSQGTGHYEEGINNQDFGIEKGRMLLILDGCSDAKYAEVGTRLFGQLFSRKEECENKDKFEDNVKEVFDELIGLAKKYYPKQKELEEKFIMENLLFTIIACFETNDEFIVKIFGDGYVITQNKYGLLSYLKYSYGGCPPYYAYKYCSNLKEFKEYNFKEFKFDKKSFCNVSIGTDGVSPFVRGNIPYIDDYIVLKNGRAILETISNYKERFFDDVTVGIFGERNENKYGTTEQNKIT